MRRKKLASSCAVAEKNDTISGAIKERCMMYQYIFFDLDGTLTDSKEGIFNCLKYAFEKLEKPCP